MAYGYSYGSYWYDGVLRSSLCALRRRKRFDVGVGDAAAVNKGASAMGLALVGGAIETSLFGLVPLLR